MGKQYRDNKLAVHLFPHTYTHPPHVKRRFQPTRKITVQMTPAVFTEKTSRVHVGRMEPYYTLQ